MLFPPAALERAMTIREVVIACRDHAVTLSYTYVTYVKLATSLGSALGPAGLLLEAVALKSTLRCAA
jgi:hypothetical protein